MGLSASVMDTVEFGLIIRIESAFEGISEANFLNHYRQDKREA
jgi:hypothetical protein